jgi:hypothetical protein
MTILKFNKLYENVWTWLYQRWAMFITNRLIVCLALVLHYNDIFVYCMYMVRAMVVLYCLAGNLDVFLVLISLEHLDDLLFMNNLCNSQTALLCLLILNMCMFVFGHASKR